MAGGGDEEQDVEEEEYLVHVEFDGLLDSNILNRPNAFFKVIGIETEKPVMQIEEQVFVGEYRDVVGTALFFEVDPNPKVEDPVFGKHPETQLRYECKTRKSLLMSRVFLKSKGISGDDDDDDEASEEEEEEISDHNRTMDAEEPSCSSGELLQQNRSKTPQQDDNTKPFQQIISQSASSFEPIAGPSWAPDVPNRIQEKSADHVSRLIAEQMTIASDINMQNIDSD